MATTKTWADLPPKALVNIFNNLGLDAKRNGRQVTSAWKKAIDSHNVVFKIELSDASALVVTKFSTKVDFIESLLVQSMTISDFDFGKIPKFRCCIFGPGNTDENIWLVLKKCTENEVDELEFKNLSIPKTIPTDQQPLNMPSLKSLSITVQINSQSEEPSQEVRSSSDDSDDEDWDEDEETEDDSSDSSEDILDLDESSDEGTLDENMKEVSMDESSKDTTLGENSNEGTSSEDSKTVPLVDNSNVGTLDEDSKAVPLGENSNEGVVDEESKAVPLCVNSNDDTQGEISTPVTDGENSNDGTQENSVGDPAANEMCDLFIRFIQHLRFGSLEKASIVLDLKESKNRDLTPLYELLNQNRESLKSLKAWLRIGNNIAHLPSVATLNLQDLDVVFDASDFMCVSPLMFVKSQRLTNLQMAEWHALNPRNQIVVVSAIVVNLTTGLVRRNAATLKSLTLKLSFLPCDRFKFYTCEQLESLEIQCVMFAEDEGDEPNPIPVLRKLTLGCQHELGEDDRSEFHIGFGKWLNKAPRLEEVIYTVEPNQYLCLGNLLGTLWRGANMRKLVFQNVDTELGDAFIKFCRDVPSPPEGEIVASWIEESGDPPTSFEILVKRNINQ